MNIPRISRIIGMQKQTMRYEMSRTALCSVLYCTVHYNLYLVIICVTWNHLGVQFTLSCATLPSLRAGDITTHITGVMGRV